MYVIILFLFIILDWYTWRNIGHEKYDFFPTHLMNKVLRTSIQVSIQDTDCFFK